MKIETEFYRLDFPKYARKIKITLSPTKLLEESELSDILHDANILYEIQKNSSIGLLGKPFELVPKLRKYLEGFKGKNQKYNSVAERLSKDMQLKVLLG